MTSTSRYFGTSRLWVICVHPRSEEKRKKPECILSRGREAVNGVSGRPSAELITTSSLPASLRTRAKPLPASNRRHAANKRPGIDTLSPLPPAHRPIRPRAAGQRDNSGLFPIFQNPGPGLYCFCRLPEQRCPHPRLSSASVSQRTTTALPILAGGIPFQTDRDDGQAPGCDKIPGK